MSAEPTAPESLGDHAPPAAIPLEQVTRPDRVYLVDGSGYIFRAFHALPMMTRGDGTPVNAVYGFTAMLMKMLEDWHAETIVVVFDASSQSFRNEFYPDYKAQRPDPPPELIPQFALIREATRAFNLPALEMQGYEADDLIATYAKLALAAGREVTIVSSDKDLMQLVRPGVAMLDPVKQKAIGPAEVMEKFGVPPDKVIEVQALAGDSVDNVPGVPGIGIKTAAQLIVEFGDLESLLAKAGTIKQPKRRESLLANAELARVSKRLVTLKDDVPVTVALDGLAKRRPDPATVAAFLTENNFKSLLAKARAKWGEAAAPAGAGDAGSLAPLGPPPRPSRPHSHAEAGGGSVARSADESRAPSTGGFDAELPEPAPAQVSWTLVQDLATLQAWVARARAARIFAIDTETTGLDPMRADIVGISLAVAPGEACYIPLKHGMAEGGLALAEVIKQVPLRDAYDALRDLLADPAVLKVGHNIKYDMLILGRDRPDPAAAGKVVPGLVVSPIDDTMVVSYVSDGGAHGHGMDDLASMHLQHKTITFDEVTGKGKARITFDKVPLDKARDYAAEDADITLRLHRFLKPRMLRRGHATVYETMDRPLIPVLAQMERTGIIIDREALNRMSLDFARRIAALEEEIHKLAGTHFTIGSPKQLGEILFEKLGLPAPRKTKTGQYATDSSVLEPLALTHPVVAKVLDWRGLSKLKSTYSDALVEQINPETGRVHTSFAQTIANTGRLSSNDPNLQNIPIRTEEGKKIREAFVAAPGHKLLSVDYSQIELRLVAEIADVAALKQAFKDGVDIHAQTASQVFGVPMDKMDGDTRRKAKAINFGIIYGISGFGLGQQLGIAPGEAQAYIRQYLDRLPELKEWLDRTKVECRERGYVETLFGRRIWIRGIKDANPAMRAFAERQSINAPIQGSAADIIKRAMLRVPPALAAKGLKARMLLQVHDELLFEVPDGEVDETAALVRQVMERAPLPARQLAVPLVADAGIGRSWAEAH